MNVYLCLTSRYQERRFGGFQISIIPSRLRICPKLGHTLPLASVIVIISECTGLNFESVMVRGIVVGYIDYHLILGVTIFSNCTGRYIDNDNKHDQPQLTGRKKRQKPIVLVKHRRSRLNEEA